MSIPRSAADPRPGNRPYFIEPDCPVCRRELVLCDRDRPVSKIWHDEWECPTCQDGAYLDWPASALETLKVGADEGHQNSADQALKALD